MLSTRVKFIILENAKQKNKIKSYDSQVRRWWLYNYSCYLCTTTKSLSMANKLIWHINSNTSASFNLKCRNFYLICKQKAMIRVYSINDISTILAGSSILKEGMLVESLKWKAWHEWKKNEMIFFRKICNVTGFDISCHVIYKYTPSIVTILFERKILPSYSLTQIDSKEKKRES